MKVAYFIGSLNRGGTETLLLDICRNKAYAPYEMVLIYRNEGELSDCFKSTGIPMFRIKPHGLMMGYFRKLRNLLKREKVNVVHTQTMTNAVAAIMFTLLSGVKVVASFHGFCKSAVLPRHFIMLHADALVFVSRFLYDWYRNNTLWCPKQRCNVVYNGISFEKFEKQYEVPDFVETIRDEKPGTVILVMVGNFMNGRSHMVICKSLCLLKNRGVRGFDFCFVGKRIENEANVYDACVNFCVENGLQDCVHFVGSRGDVPAILQHVDGFVYSTVRDTFGIAVIEAVSSGLPTLVNDWSVMKEVTCDGRFASYFKSNNIEDCCNQMQLLIENIEQRKKEAFYKAENIKKLYSIEKHIDSLAVVYNSICE